MRSQVSANGVSYSRQEGGKRSKNRKKIIIIGLLALGILCAAFLFSHISLNQFVGEKLAAVLGREVGIGRVSLNSYRGLRLDNVSIHKKEVSLIAPTLFLDTKFHPTGRIGIKKVTLRKPVILLRESQGRLPRCDGGFFRRTKPISPTTFPTIVVDQGKLIFGGEEINVEYLRFTGFASESGVSGEIFANVGFAAVLVKRVENSNSHQRKKIPVKLAGKFSFTGWPGENIHDSKMVGVMYLSDLRAGNFKIQEFHSGVKFAKGMLSFTGIDAQAYTGPVKGVVQFDIRTGQYLVEFTALRLRLDDLSRELGLKGKNISGELDVRLKFGGDRKDRQTWQGSGAARVRNGQLWEIPVLYGLATLIMKPAYSREVFRRGGADFTIGRGAIETKNLKLVGDNMGLAARGNIRFDEKLDFTVTTVFTKQFMARTPELLEVTSILSRILDYFIVQYQIGGTVRKPSYKIVPLPVIKTIPQQIGRILGMLFPGKAEEAP